MNGERSGIELLEEAVSVGRRAPARAWTWYLSGAIPFFAALLFYVRATTGVLSVPDPGPGALLLAVLFGWRQFTRSLFGRILAEEISETRTALTPGLCARAAARTWFAGLMRVVVPFPAPWISALFRNYQAYAWDEPGAFRRAAEVAGRGGGATVAWLTLGAMSILVWFNVFMGMVGVPMLYQIFTGEETTLTRNMDAVLNRTVLLGSLMVAWCLCDAVVEAMYVLCRFYGESEQTGADLIRLWRKAIARASAGAALTVCIVAGLHAQSSPTQGSPARTELNQAIDEVLAQRQYQWREPPAPHAGDEWGLVRWMKSAAGSIKRLTHSLLRPLRRVWEGFLNWLRNSGKRIPQGGPRPPVDALRLATVLAILLLAGALVALLIRTRSRRPAPVAGASTAMPIPVNLEDPDVVATDLPEDQWLALAREWAEKGDTRMALRAWFLGCLAFLNRRELVSISRYKSNLDYRRELARRARGIAGLDAEFAASVRSFETAWYGLYPLEAADVESFAAGFERMKGLCS